MFEDRQYQLNAVDYALEAMKAGRRPILCSPTGSGKSVMMAKIAKEYIDAGKRVGIMTPREEILFQMRDTCRQVIGANEVTVLKAGERYFRFMPLQVVSWPTLLARTAMDPSYFPQFDCVMYDEAHLSVSPKMVERILPHYEKRAHCMGVTATPARKSGMGLGAFYSNIKHVTSVRQLLDDGKLAPLEYWAGQLPDIEGVKTTGGDFNTKQLRERTAPLVGDVIDNWARICEDRHTLVFAVDVPHCEALAERFQQAGVKAASLHIHKTPERRHQIIEKFKAREIQVLVNVQIASYGFDAPTLDCIVMARPTKSIVLHLQMLGRGMRTSPGKNECIVLDHADNVRRLGAADDPYRWRLSGKKPGAENWKRHEANPEKETAEEKLRECDECHYMFARSLVCPKCGWEIPLPKRDVEAVKADLVRISEQKYGGMPDKWPEPRRFYLMLLYYARVRKFDDKWAYYSYRDFVEENPDVRPQSPPMKWKQERIIKPTVRVSNWLEQRKRAYLAAKDAKSA